MTGFPELSINEGLQAEAFDHYSPSEPLEVPKETLFFYWALVVRASLAGGCWERHVIFLSSAPSGPLPPCPLFVFWSATSLEDARVGARVGGQGTTETVREASLV